MSSSKVEIRAEDGVCRICGEPVELSRAYLDGAPLIPTMPVTCSACLEAEDAPVAQGPQDPLDWLHEHGVNTRKHGTATLDSFDATYAPAAIRAARDFLADVLAAGRHARVRGLYLVHASTGTGKSHLAVAIMRAVHEARPQLRVVYDPADRLITRVQDSYGTGATDSLIETRRQAGLYVLDDLGREKGTEDALRTIATILDEREGAPTVITGNDLPARLAERYRDGAMWDRVASRLGDQVYRYVQVPGPDRRFRAGA